MTAINEGHPIVIDFGSAYVRSGAAGDNAPRTAFPTVYARARQYGYISHGFKELYVGEDAYARYRGDHFRTLADMQGVINWDMYETFLNEACYSGLRVAPENHPILLTEPMFSPVRHREKTTEIIFESLRAQALYLKAKPVLALLATGATTGLVVDSGEEATSVVPVYRGHSSSGKAPFAVAGVKLTRQMRERFVGPLEALEATDRNRPFRFERVPREMKEAMCFVAEDYEIELARAVDVKEDGFLLPDGNLLEVEISRFQVPEAMFQPSIVGLVDKGIHEAVADAIVASEPSTGSELISNIVLSGGNTKIRGFVNRLRNELGSLDPSFRGAGIVAPADREWSSWLGGSMLSSLSTFESMCIKFQEYDEYGPTLVHRMAP